jgi:hypothetical protein
MSCSSGNGLSIWSPGTKQSEDDATPPSREMQKQETDHPFTSLGDALFGEGFDTAPTFSGEDFSK